MEAFFVVVLAAVMLAVGAVSLLLASRLGAFARGPVSRKGA